MLFKNRRSKVNSLVLSQIVNMFQDFMNIHILMSMSIYACKKERKKERYFKTCI